MDINLTEPPAPVMTTTIKLSGPGKISFDDLRDMVNAVADAGLPSSGVDVDVVQERSYDSDAREMRYDEWSMTATVAIPR